MSFFLCLGRHGRALRYKASYNLSRNALFKWYFGLSPSIPGALSLHLGQSDIRFYCRVSFMTESAPIINHLSSQSCHLSFQSRHLYIEQDFNAISPVFCRLIQKKNKNLKILFLLVFMSSSPPDRIKLGGSIFGLLKHILRLQKSIQIHQIFHAHRPSYHIRFAVIESSLQAIL